MIWNDQDLSGLVRIGQDRSGQIRIGHLRSGQDRPGHGGMGQDRSGREQVRPGGFLIFELNQLFFNSIFSKN